jgi:hypothetical protein
VEGRREEQNFYKKMIKLFSLKQQKKEGETGGQKSQRSAAQLRITKGKRKTHEFPRFHENLKIIFHFAYFGFVDYRHK